MYVKNKMICTVGRSLLSNFERADATLKDNFSHERILDELLQMDPSNKKCGAEINSINSIIKQGAVDDRLHLVFLVSDTDEGNKIGMLLKDYFSSKNCQIRFEQVSIKMMKGLNGEDRYAFKQRGLKEVAKSMTELATEDPYSTIINATGGYKAQISFAVLLGQILKIKVYYMFQGFNDIIELPPLPVSFDYSLWMKNYDLLEILEKGTFDQNLVKDVDEHLKVLYDVEKGGKDKLYILNAMGTIFHKGFKKLFKMEENFLPPKRKEEPKYIASLKEGHSKIFDNKFKISDKILEIPYITKLTCNYYNPKSGDFNKAKFKNEKLLEITFAKNGKAIGFIAETTAKTELQRNALKIFISEKMKEW